VATKIYNVTDLQNMSLDLAGDYELANDVDADDFDFQPIGSVLSKFTGNFDGCGHKISNLTINQGGHDVFIATNRPESDDAVSGTWTVYPASPTTLYDKVNETSADDDDTYIESSIADSRALFGFSGLNIPVGARDIYVRVYHRRKRIGSGTARQFIRINDTNYDGTTSTPSTSYGTTLTTWSTNPVTGNPWTSAEVNSLQGFGINLVSGTVRSTQVYLYITFNFDYLGLFGYTQNSTLKNVTLEDVLIVGSNSQYVGGVVGYANACTIQDVEVSAVIRGLRRYIGGVVGYARYLPASISRCTAKVDIFSDTSGDYVGGIVGYSGVDIEDCYADVDIVCFYNAGGIVGYFSSVGEAVRSGATGRIRSKDDSGGFAGYSYGKISESYAFVDIDCFSSEYSSGGFVGYSYNTIKDCYSTGSVTHYASGSWSGVGGFCGYNESSIISCYSTGLVTGEDDIGGFCGYTRGYIANCFWDIETSGTSIGVGEDVTSSIPFSITSNRSYSGDYSVYFGDLETFEYSNNQLSILELKDSIDLSSTEAPSLSFYLWPDIENSYDFLYLDVSINNGLTWTEDVWHHTGQDKEWLSENVDLSSYKHSQVKIKFRFTSDSSVVYEGAYIDDVVIKDDEKVIFSDDFNSGGDEWIFEPEFSQVEGKLTQEMRTNTTFSGWDVEYFYSYDKNKGYPFLGWQADESTTWLRYPLIQQFNLNRKKASPQTEHFSTVRKFSIHDGAVIRTLKNVILRGSINRKLVSDILIDSFKSVRDIRHEFPTKFYKTVRDFGAGYTSKIVRLVNSSFGDKRPFSIQRGSITLSGSASSVLLDTPVEVGKSFVICSTRGTASDPSSSMARVYLSDVVGANYTKITAARNSTTGTCYVEWQVISGDQFSVQSGSIACNASYKDVNISKVDLSKSFIFVSSTTNSGNIYRGLVRVKFNSDTQIEIRKGDSDTTFFPTVQWYVVEWDGASVQSGLVTNSSQTNTANISGVDLDKSFLAYNYYVTSTSSNSAYAFVRGRFSSNSQVEFMRGSSTNSAYVSYFVISHPDIIVSSGLITISGTSENANVSTESFLPVTSVGNAYQTSTSTSTLHHGYNTHSLNDTTLTVERTDSTGTLYASWFAVKVDTTIIPQPKFSYVRKLSSSVSEFKKLVRLLSAEVLVNLFKTFRGFITRGSNIVIRNVQSSLTFKGYVFCKVVTIESEEEKNYYRIKFVIYKEVGIDSGNTIYLSNNCKDDFSDVHFDGELTYWCEYYVSGDYAVFWVEFNHLDAIPVKNNYSILYLKNDAISESDFYNTIEHNFWQPYKWGAPDHAVYTPYLLTTEAQRSWGGSEWSAYYNQMNYIYYNSFDVFDSTFYVKFTSFDLPSGFLDRACYFCSVYADGQSVGGQYGIFTIFRRGDIMYIYDGVEPWDYINVRNTSYSRNIGSMFTGVEYKIRINFDGANWKIYVDDDLKRTLSQSPKKNTPLKGMCLSARNVTNSYGNCSIVVEFDTQDYYLYQNQYDSYSYDINIVDKKASIFSSERKPIIEVSEFKKSIRSITSFTDFVGKTIRDVYINLADVLTARRLSSIVPSSIIPSEFSTNRKLANVVIERFKSVRRLSVAFSKLFSTLRLFSFRALFKNIRSITWPLEKPKQYTFVYKGQWINTVSYIKDDIVWYNVGGVDKTYKALVNNSGHQVTESNYWEYLYDGQHKFNIPHRVSNVDVLVVAGGGGGGCMGGSHQYGYNNSGGGGAGGLVFVDKYNIFKYKVYGYISVVVGKGGLGGIYQNTYCGDDGDDSYFGDIKAFAGGGGGLGVAYCSSYQSKTGGSGGGGGYWRNNAGPPYSSCCSGSSGIQPTTNDGYVNTGFGNSGVGCPGGGGGAGSAGSNSSPYNGGFGKIIWDITYSVGGDGARSTILSGASNTGNGGDGGANTSGTRFPGGNGGSGIVIVKCESDLYYFQTKRSITSYFSKFWLTVRKPSILIEYIATTLRLFKAEFFGATYRFGINVITSPFKVNRRLSSDITTMFSTVRRPSIIAGYIGSTLRQFSFISSFITKRFPTLTTMYKASTNRKLSSVFVDKFKVLRFPSMFYQWLGSTFRRVGELCIDLINRVTFPPKE